jgi:hypothetical protein
VWIPTLRVCFHLTVCVRLMSAAHDTKNGLGLAVVVAEMMLAMIAGNIREVCEGVVGKKLSSRDWTSVATRVCKDIEAIQGTSAIQQLVNANACSQNWESAAPQWQHRERRRTCRHWLRTRAGAAHQRAS